MRLSLLLLLPGAFAAPSWVPQDFRDWASEHGKRYTSEHAWQRAISNYEENTKIINTLNSQEDGAVYGHTRFSDLSVQEFGDTYLPNTMNPEEGKRGGATPPTLDQSLDIPAAFDWRDHGAITPVRDQASCGSCWAESAVGNMESIWYLANKDKLKAIVPLSVEQVVECDPHDYACYGGFPKGGYEYVLEHGGLASEADYPYSKGGKTICLANQTYNQTCGDGMCDDPPLTNWCDLKCSDNKHKSAARISSWSALPTDEDKIAAFLVQHGPVSVGMNAQGGFLGVLFPWLQFYKHGVANPRGCKGSTLSSIDHGVLLVGFGEDSGKKYWTVKNSWGPKWGEEGYFRLQRGEGLCAINLMATSASVKSGSSEMVV